MQIFRRCLTLVVLLAAATASAASLRGAMLVAADGTFLGTCDGEYGTYSIANPYSRYGSKYGTNSIFNEYSQYGSPFGTYSAFNKVSANPPYLLSADAALLRMFTSATYRPTPQIANALRGAGGVRVTANRAIASGVDPNVLRVTCETP